VSSPRPAEGAVATRKLIIRALSFAYRVRGSRCGVDIMTQSSNGWYGRCSAALCRPPLPCLRHAVQKRTQLQYSTVTTSWGSPIQQNVLGISCLWQRSFSMFTTGCMFTTRTRVSSTEQQPHPSCQGR
jgi:hypothetical protein